MRTLGGAIATILVVAGSGCTATSDADPSASQLDELPPVSVADQTSVTGPDTSVSPTPPSTVADPNPVASGVLGARSVEVWQLDTEFDYGPERDPIQEADQATFADAVVLESGTVIAAGSDSLDGTPSGAVWRNADGGRFVRVFPDGPSWAIRGLAALPGDEVIAVGHLLDDSGDATMWAASSTDDGQTWAGGPEIDDALVASVSTVGADAYATVVRSPFSDAKFGVLRYRNGTWTETAWPEDPAAVASSIVETDDGSLVAVGTRCRSGCAAADLFALSVDAAVEPAVWISSDGDTWSPMAIEVTESSVTEIVDVAVSDDDLYAVARTRNDGIESLRVLRSVDGSSWDVIADPQLANQRGRADVVHLTVRDEHLILVATTGSPTIIWDEASVVLIDTATSEHRVVEVSAPADIFNIAGVVERADRLELFGTDQQPGRPDAVRVEIRID